MWGVSGTPPSAEDVGSPHIARIAERLGDDIA